MTVSRRTILKHAALPLIPFAQRAKSDTVWPEKPIRIIVGYPAGQNADITARTYGTHISRVLGQPIFIENRPGANGLLGAQLARNSRPDGYTWLWGGSGPLAINPALYRNAQYDPVRDFKAVCLTSRGPLYLIAHPSFAANNFKELVALARRKPGEVDYATAGNGSTAHLAMKLLEAEAGLKLNHIPYKGSPAALNDLSGGQIGLMMEAGASSTTFMKSGRVKALGMTGRQRSTAAPSVPTIAEQGLAGFEAYAWNGIVVPANTSVEIVNRIAAATSKALETSTLRDELAAQGTQQAWMPPAEFENFLMNEVKKWAKAVKLSGAQLD